jgi:hypothetical protein
MPAETKISHMQKLQTLTIIKVICFLLIWGFFFHTSHTFMRIWDLEAFGRQNGAISEVSSWEHLTIGSLSLVVLPAIIAVLVTKWCFRQKYKEVK